MKKQIILLFLLLCYTLSFCQKKEGQQIELYAIPQLFTAHLSNDSLVPPKGRGKSRLGDEGIFGMQYGRVFGKHLLLKAGVGFSSREFSLAKYNLDDFFTAFFLFDSPGRLDSFPVSRVQYHLHYLDVPLTITYEKGIRGANVQMHCGLTARLQFLSRANITVTPDFSSPVQPTTNTAAAEKVYADDVRSFVVSVQPYADLYFRIYQGLSLSLRMIPFSVYASPLTKRVSRSQGESLGAGVSLAYQF